MNPNGGRSLHVLLIGGQTGSFTPNISGPCPSVYVSRLKKFERSKIELQLFLPLRGGGRIVLPVVLKSRDPKETLLETRGVSCNGSLASHYLVRYMSRGLAECFLCQTEQRTGNGEIQTGAMGEWLTEKTAVKQECASLPLFVTAR